MASWIKNYDAVAVTPLRRDALDVLEAGLSAVDTKHVIDSSLVWDSATKTLCVEDGTNICFSDYEHIYFVGFGKCAVDAGLAIEEKFGDALTAGAVLDVHGGTFKKLSSLVGTHPLPAEQNVVATDEIVALLEHATERDLIIAVISGGGSALLCSPHDMDCDTFATVTHTLMKKAQTFTSSIRCASTSHAF